MNKQNIEGFRYLHTHTPPAVKTSSHAPGTVAKGAPGAYSVEYYLYRCIICPSWTSLSVRPQHVICALDF